jgi:hypothetical protein
LVVVAFVALAVALEFGLPVVLIRLRHLAVYRAGVPEAAVYEDGYSPPGEGDIDMDAAACGSNEVIDPESQAGGVQS